MKTIILIVISALFIGVSSSFSQNAGLEIGAKNPLMDYSMKATNGSVYQLKDLQGDNGLLVVFSCNSCPFVVGMKDGSFPGWEVQYNELAGVAMSEGVNMVLVNSNEAKRSDDDSMEEMIKRANDKGYLLPYLLDKNSVLADAYGAKTTPHVYFFDKNGVLIFKGSIDNTWDPKRSQDIPFLKNALKQFSSEIVVKESDPRGCSIKRVAKSK